MLNSTLVKMMLKVFTNYIKKNKCPVFINASYPATVDWKNTF